MAFGPTNQPIKLTAPDGKLAQWTMTTQAENAQTMVISNGSGRTLATHTASGTTARPAAGTFTVNGAPLTVTLTFSSGGNSSASTVIYSCTANTKDNEIKNETYTFAAEDAGDADFNDNFVTLTYFQTTG